jgi:hypothetical protein
VDCGYDKSHSLGRRFQWCCRTRSRQRARHGCEPNARLWRLFVLFLSIPVRCHLIYALTAVQKNFVQTVRAVEQQFNTNIQPRNWKRSSSNFTESLRQASKSRKYNSEVRAALRDAAPILMKLAAKHSMKPVFNVYDSKKKRDGDRREPLITRCDFESSTRSCRGQLNAQLALWILFGNITILKTLLTLPVDLRHTMIICTIRKHLPYTL